MLSHPFLAENSLFKLVGEIFHPLFELFGLILAGLYAVWPNYGFAITGLTIIIMLALTPVTVKSTKSMLAMQRLQPEMKKLQAKYKGAENRELLNQEMMKLYKENGTSPFGACLPSLLQMPFLIVLYSLIRGLSYLVPKGQSYTNAAGHTVTCMAKAGCASPRYIPTASKMHDALIASNGQMHWWFGMDLSSLPFSHHASPGSASQAVLVLPYLVLIGAAMFLQYYQMKQMNSRNPQAAAANPQMQQMQKFFPIIFGVIYLRVPAGATIYMVVSSAMRIGTQEIHVPVRHGHPGRARARDRCGAKEKEKEKPPPPKRGKKTRPRPTGRRRPRRPCRRRRAADEEQRRQDERPVPHERAEAGRGSVRRTAGRRAATTVPGRHRRPSPIRGRAQSGQERLDRRVEWVEVAGKTVEEATEQALDQLGVAVGDAEVIVVDEPKTGLFGRVRVEARVRARVRPVGARPRRERSRRSGGGSRSSQGGQGGGRQGGQRSSAGRRRPERVTARRCRMERTRGTSTNGRTGRAPRRPVPAAAPVVRPAAGAIAARRRPQVWRRRKARGTARGGRRPRKLHNGASKQRRQRTWPRE